MIPEPLASEPSSLAVALEGECPRCGKRTLFANWVRFASNCPNCGLCFEDFNVGDGPAAFLIFIVGTIVVVGALVIDGVFSPPWWIHLVWIPVATGLTLGGLRLSKGWLLAQEYRHRAREGRILK
ncbi:MAG TPA: DUF983 domain-containing protein [Sphingomicrobium sp.]|nr:DUF983 domain-containing protein [Sphingomicrobium sp.]